MARIKSTVKARCILQKPQARKGVYIRLKLIICGQTWRKFKPAYEIQCRIAYLLHSGDMPICLIRSLWYFVHARSEGSGDEAFAQVRLSLRCSHKR